MAVKTIWRGQSDTRVSRVLGVLGLSLLLHLPFSPLIEPLGWIHWVKLSEPEEPPLDEWAGIPVTLLPEEEGVGELSPSDTEASPSEPSPPLAAEEQESKPEREGWSLPAPKPKPAPKPEAPAELDGGLAALDAGPDAASEADAGSDAALDAAPEAAAPKEEKPDAGAPKPPRQEKPLETGPVAERSGSIGDPVALSGAAGKLADDNAHVRLLVFADRVRKHPLGSLVGELLVGIEQWRVFFQHANLNPIRDIDRILIAAPQLRDSSGAVIILKHNQPEKKIHAAIDGLVQHGEAKGEWLSERTAKAHVERAARVFVQPAKGIVVVGPPGLEAQAEQLGASLRFPASGGAELVTVFLRTPSRAFRGIPFKVPSSISWVRLKVVPGEGNAVVAELEAQDESEDAARKHAQELEQGLRAITSIRLSGLAARVLGRSEKKLVESVRFSASGDRIIGRVVATEAQLKPLLQAISQYNQQLQEQAKQRAEEREKAKAAAEASANPPGSSSAAPEAPPRDAGSVGGDDGGQRGSPPPKTGEEPSAPPAKPDASTDNEPAN